MKTAGQEKVKVVNVDCLLLRYGLVNDRGMSGFLWRLDMIAGCRQKEDYSPFYAGSM